VQLINGRTRKPVALSVEVGNQLLDLIKEVVDVDGE